MNESTATSEQRLTPVAAGITAAFAIFGGAVLLGVMLFLISIAAMLSGFSHAN